MPDDSKDRSYVVKMALRNALKLIPGLEQKNQRQERGYRGAQAAAGAQRVGQRDCEEAGQCGLRIRYPRRGTARSNLAALPPTSRAVTISWFLSWQPGRPALFDCEF